MRLSVRRLLVLLAVLAAIFGMTTPAGADKASPSFTDFDILNVLGRAPPYWQITSALFRFTHFDQDGHGYQSRTGSLWGPGSERMRVEQPQLDLVLKQGKHITHRVWLPVDIVTAASPDAVDVVSRASAGNEAGSFDWTITYSGAGKGQFFMRNGFHAEENYRSYNFGLIGARSFAEDNTVVDASVTHVLDWFDQYLKPNASTASR